MSDSHVRRLTSPAPAGKGNTRAASSVPTGPSLADNAYPPTLWTVVLTASRPEQELAAEALGRLAEHYREAILCWFERAGVAPPDAEDLTHDFLVHLLSGKALNGFEQRQARFRTFLQACLRNFLRDHRRRRSAAKRGSGSESLPLECAKGVSVALGPAPAFDAAIAQVAHARAVERVRREWLEAGHERRFSVLNPFLLGAPPANGYAHLAQELGLTTSHLRKVMFDLREDYYQALRREVAQTVSPADIDDEMRHLVVALATTCDPA